MHGWQKAIVTAEESTKTGGLGSAIASLIIGEVNYPSSRLVWTMNSEQARTVTKSFSSTEKDIVKAAKKALKKLENKMNIGFIGIVIMCRPMAKNLLKAGYSLIVYDKFA